MSLIYTGHTACAGGGHLTITLTKDAVPHAFPPLTVEQIDQFLVDVAAVVPGLSGGASALEKRAKAMVLLQVAYLRAEGFTLSQIQGTDLEAL